MAERNTAEELDDVYEIKYSTDAMTGGADKRMYLYYQLADSIKKADSVDIIVSFLMESGVKMLLGELDDALKRGAKIRILTGNYLGITQPSALYLIKNKLGEQVDLRFYNEKNRSFHPKSYMFHYKDYSELYIGSSNISRSALTSGIEWNYRFSNKTDPINYEKFYNTFVDLFENHSIVIDDEELKKYSKNWHRPAVSKDLDRYDLQDDKETSNQIPLFEPRGAQIEALCALGNTRAEGARRALVQAATGVGKTYLAAFDSKNYERVLFVAHREEILKQAAESFKNVRDSDDYGFFNGDSKCTEKSVIFASVATLGRVEYLNENYFAPDYFTYVVIDEFHHANEQYQRIVDYFKPKFLLGLTATPERMDGKNIYEICDYNVPYEISLKEAINKGMLVPFHYYGIFDETDYSKLHIVRGRYDEKELNEKLKDQIINEYFRVKELLGRRPDRMDLFTYMDDGIYEIAIAHSKDNPFKKYLEFLKKLDELNQDEEVFYKGIGREFISLLENTSMSKVYKMPVLMAFYNHGNILMEVSEEQLLSSWKEFFSTGTNWKDLDKNMTIQKYNSISDKEHLKKILSMPVHFLLESGKGFFVKKDGVAIGLREELRPLIDNPVMVCQMKDVIDYRAMDYYQRRYRQSQEDGEL